MTNYVEKLTLTLFLFKMHFENSLLKKFKIIIMLAINDNKRFIKVCIGTPVRTLNRRFIYVKYVVYHFFLVLFFILKMNACFV